MICSLQNFQRAASLCAMCKYYVEDLGGSGVEGGAEGVMGTMVTLMAM
jgi:hypothetical protein